MIKADSAAATLDQVKSKMWFFSLIWLAGISSNVTPCPLFLPILMFGMKVQILAPSLPTWLPSLPATFPWSQVMSSECQLSAGVQQGWNIQQEIGWNVKFWPPTPPCHDIAGVDGTVNYSGLPSAFSWNIPINGVETIRWEKIELENIVAHWQAWQVLWHYRHSEALCKGRGGGPHVCAINRKISHIVPPCLSVARSAFI